LIFLVATSFALGSVLTRRVETDLPVETMEAWSMLSGAVLLHLVSLGLAESTAQVRWTGEALLALGYLVVVASALGFLIYFALLERLGPIEINLVSYAAPGAAVVTGLLVLGERPTVYTAAGFACILLGFVLIKRRALRAELARLRWPASSNE
jgi:drug/metabolite transporter (DMT)-like permease